jgi:hypothetical protein
MTEENRTLRPEHILETIAILHKRIEERFGDRGLTRTCADLSRIARSTAKRAARLGQPYWGLRLLAYGIIALGGYGIYQVIELYGMEPAREIAQIGPLNLAQGLEALLNLVLLCGIALLFVVGLEGRIKRARALRGLYELRSVAHVIDMHQLTKDPQSMLANMAPTRFSPKRDLTSPQLMRYLDYCTEMLSLIAKLAALYAETMRDSAVIAAVNDVETLTSSMTDKIFHKLRMIEREIAQDAAASSTPLPRLAEPVR